MANADPNTPIPNSAYYYSTQLNTSGVFYNSVYALNIDLEQYFADILFNGDLTRIVYAPNSYAFRERARLNKGNINIPFMNYYLTKIEPDSKNRQLKKNVANIQGLLDDPDGYVESVGDKLLVVPSTFLYEATVWYNQPQDLIYAYNQMALANVNETIIHYFLNAPNNNTLKLSAFLYLNLDMNPEYDDNDWLEKNKIVSMALDPDFVTTVIYPSAQTSNSIVSISKTVIFNFLVAKGLINHSNPIDTPYEDKLTEYFTTPVN